MPKKGSKMSDEHKAKISAAQKGIHRPNQGFKKGHMTNVGRKHTLQSRLNMSIGTKGKKHRKFSDQARKNMSEAHKGKKRSSETCERISKSLKGKIKSAEHVEKIAKATRKYSEIEKYNAHEQRIKFQGWLKGQQNNFELIVGIPLSAFKNYIESKFKPGMTWDDRRTFHLDHHCPLSAFDITTEQGVKAAWNWTNLQPLYPSENHTKGSTIPTFAKFFDVGQK